MEEDFIVKEMVTECMYSINIFRGKKVCVCVCVCLALCEVDILITNTIWLSRHEVYLPHIHAHNLLRVREESRGARKKQKDSVKRGTSGGRTEGRKEIKGREDKGKQMDTVSQCYCRFKTQYDSVEQRRQTIMCGQ